ncbi:hypothetical protein C1T30_41160 [Bacillus sp. MBGLi97]|nr:hypothetical protein C1T30_41160 [Bacillus sp. MBGLi97]
MHKDEFIYTMFIIDLIQKANDKGFKFLIDDKKITVFYPMYGATYPVIISNMNEFKQLCKDVLADK